MSSDRTAWAIASKWMSHFVFIPQRGGHSAKPDIFTLRQGNMLIKKKNPKPLQSALVFQSLRRNTRKGSDHVGVYVFSLISLQTVISLSSVWEFNILIQCLCGHVFFLMFLKLLKESRTETMISCVILWAPVLQPGRSDCLLAAFLTDGCSCREENELYLQQSNIRIIQNSQQVRVISWSLMTLSSECVYILNKHTCNKAALATSQCLNALAVATVHIHLQLVTMNKTVGRPAPRGPTPRSFSGVNPVWPSLYPSFAPWMTLLCPRRLTCCSSDGCLPSGQGVPMLSSDPQQAGR